MATAVDHQPRGRPRRDPAARRWELYRAAAPLLASQGYQGVGMKALARACHLSPPTLYYYFPSKLALALFPLTPEGGICRTWSERVRGLSIDPLVRVRELIDSMVGDSEILFLALDLAEQAGTPEARQQVAEASRHALLAFADAAEGIAPGLDRERLADLGQGLLKVLGGSRVPGMNRDPLALRRQMVDATRGWLVPAGVDPTRFDSIMTRR